MSLFDLKKRLQIILKKTGGKREEENIKQTTDMFGSVTFSLKKLAQAKAGMSYIQWVSLFDSLEDDVYDGQLGEDDWDPGYPRVLLEYQIVGGKYTSTFNGLEAIKSKANHAIQSDYLGYQEAGGSAV